MLASEDESVSIFGSLFLLLCKIYTLWILVVAGWITYPYPDGKAASGDLGGPDSVVYRKINELEQFKLEGPEDQKANTCFELGKAYATLDFTQLALQEFEESLNGYRQMHDSSGVVRVLLSISDAYVSVQEFDQALSFVLEARMNQADSVSDREIYARLGYLYFNLLEYDSAESYLSKSADMFTPAGFRGLRPLIHLGELKLIRGNTDRALEVLLNIERNGWSDDSPINKFQVYNLLRAVYALKGLSDRSDDYRRKRDSVKIDKALIERNLDFYAINLAIDTLIGDYKGAVLDEKEYLLALKSIYKQDFIARLESHQKVFELHDNEQKIKLLKQENELYRLRERESGFYELIMAIGILLFFVLAAVFLRSALLRSRNNRELIELNRQIIAQSTDIRLKNEQLERALQNLKDTQYHLIQSEKMASVGTFVSGIAHELNNPINMLTGGIQMMKRSFSKMMKRVSAEDHELMEDTTHLLDLSGQNMRKVTRIIQSLTSATQMQRATVMNLAEIIENVEHSLRPYWPEDVELMLHLQKVDVECFPIRIHHAVRSILENAAYYAMHGGNDHKYVSVILRRQGGYALVILKNNGPKIPEEHLMRIFDPFFTTKEDLESPGLGLYFAFSAISDHQGVLEVINGAEEVEFVIQLPVTLSAG